MLIETGCRLSEALALEARSIDVRQRVIIFESLKKRRRGIYRAVPISEGLVDRLDRQFDVTAKWTSGMSEMKLCNWSRSTAYRHVCAMMMEAGIRGGHASPRGLRHAFGVAAVSAGIPLNLVQRWLGHSDMKATAIYANVSGPEERLLASRTWLSSFEIPTGFRPATVGMPHPACGGCPYFETVRIR